MNPNIEKPTAVLNVDVAKRNITRMAEKARQSRVRFRPHFKTHQSAVIGEWFRDEGVTAITVSSVDMARYFAENGWSDILIAFPVNWLEIDKINELAATTDLNLLLESVETAHFLADRLVVPVKIWLKADTGYHRTGILWNDVVRLRQVAGAVANSEKMALQGLLTHAGHSYAARSRAEIQAVYDETVERLNAARSTLFEAGFDGLEISLGDTPCCAVLDDFSAVDEIRPGNFVFYDLTQVQIGSCQPEDVAVAVACPIVAVHPAEHTVVVYGGGIHLSKERMVRADGNVSYGEVVLPDGEAWGEPVPGSFVKGLSQEHGIIHASDILLEQVGIGDVMFVLPVHSCMTVNLLKQYHTLSGEIIKMAAI
jgi:D-serine deaminase-like pyridoxal phosphate-dependent protein